MLKNTKILCEENPKSQILPASLVNPKPSSSLRSRKTQSLLMLYVWILYSVTCSLIHRDDGIERERMRCGDWRAERERRKKRREDGREKREARQQTLDSRACWMQTLKTFEEIWKSLTGLSRTLLWFRFPAHDNHTLRAHHKRANTFIHRVFIWVSVRNIFWNFREWRRHFVYDGDRDAENQGYRRWGDDYAHYLLPFPCFQNTCFGFCVWVFFCVFPFSDSQLCILSFISLLLLLLFCFSFLIVVEGMRRDACDGETERRQRETERGY